MKFLKLFFSKIKSKQFLKTKKKRFTNIPRSVFLWSVVERILRMSHQKGETYSRVHSILNRSVGQLFFFSCLNWDPFQNEFFRKCGAVKVQLRKLVVWTKNFFFVFFFCINRILIYLRDAIILFNPIFPRRFILLLTLFLLQNTIFSVLLCSDNIPS